MLAASAIFNPIDVVHEYTITVGDMVVGMWVIKAPEYRAVAEHYNGYAVFPTSFINCHYTAIENMVQVHGGITYSHVDDDWAVYGFDTCHYNSDRYQISDPVWIIEEIKKMITDICAISREIRLDLFVNGL